MSGLDIEIIMHHLSITPSIKLVKQNLRKMHPHITLFVKDELEKFPSEKFIIAINYVEWISNIVSISKHDKSIWVYTDSRDLHKACPKDDFSIRTWKMFFDGSYTQNEVGSGLLFITPHGYTIPKY